ncbi:MAG: hypothetical protein HOQ05_06380 [Corynebacteriales bacterium]|nr:hypothetical protein [Mycobacteriales bacterium]
MAKFDYDLQVAREVGSDILRWATRATVASIVLRQRTSANWSLQEEQVRRDLIADIPEADQFVQRTSGLLRGPNNRDGAEELPQSHISFQVTDPYSAVKIQLQTERRFRQAHDSRRAYANTEERELLVQQGHKIGTALAKNAASNLSLASGTGSQHEVMLLAPNITTQLRKGAVAGIDPDTHRRFILAAELALQRAIASLPRSCHGMPPIEPNEVADGDPTTPLHTIWLGVSDLIGDHYVREGAMEGTPRFSSQLEHIRGKDVARTHALGRDFAVVATKDLDIREFHRLSMLAPPTTAQLHDPASWVAHVRSRPPQQR